MSLSPLVGVAALWADGHFYFTSRQSARAGAPECVTLLVVDAAQQVLAAARARARALAEQDAARLGMLLHEDFRWTTHTGDTYDRAEYVCRNTEGGTVWRSQSLDDVDVVVVGDTAVLCAEVTDVVRRRGSDEAESFRMPMTQVWVLADGDWQCLAGHAGPRLT